MTQIDDTTLLIKLRNYKQSAYNWQQRRHDQWRENYELYRDTVIVNRLTQRQSVNIPLIKGIVRTLLSKFKSKLDLVFEDLGGDKQKDIFKNELWKNTVLTAKLKAKDTVNKKQVMLYGRSFWKLFIANKQFDAEVLDPHDILIDRDADPADIDGTAMCVIHLHIYRTLRELQNSKIYDQAEVEKLIKYYSSEDGLRVAGENAASAAAKAQIMQEMGVPDVLAPVVGETVVELNEYYVRLWNDQTKRFEFNLATVVDNVIIRKATPLDQILGKTKSDYWLTHTSLVTWADDIERTDIWSDGVADILRTINKVINAWFSQLVENRTLHNLSMMAYDATAKEGWAPQTFDPVPFGWIPVPGKPADVFQRLDVDPLEDSLETIQFAIGLGEKATAASSAEQGASEQKQITLGEIKLLLNNADERIDDMQEPYEDSWLEFGEKWSVLTESAANQLEAVTLYKKSYKGNYFDKTLNPKDWQSKNGYNCTIKTQADKERDQMNGIQKLLAIKAQFPANVPLKEIVDQKLLDLGDINPEQQKQIMDFERQLTKQGATISPGAPPGSPPGAPPGPPGLPAPAVPAIKPAMNVPVAA